MKRITIGQKEYTLEFSIDATLYNECTEKVMDLMVSAGIAQAEAEDDKLSEKEKITVMANAFTTTVADIGNRALTLFYAGLLEHHGASGDNTVTSKQDAKRLIAQYINENAGLSLYDIVNEMVEEMGKDHFFEKIGVEKMVSNANQTVEKQIKTPQDHKKKQSVGNK